MLAMKSRPAKPKILKARLHAWQYKKITYFLGYTLTFDGSISGSTNAGLPCVSLSVKGDQVLA